MSYKQVKQVLAELTPEQTEFLKTRKYEGRQNVTKWLELFHKLSTFDELGDAARASAKKRSIWFGVFSFLSILICLSPYLIIIPILLLSAFAYSLTIFFKLKKMDLSNHLREQIYPFLAIIKDDLPKKEKIIMKLDFSDPMNDKYLTETIPNEGRGYPKIKTRFYTHIYFYASFTMEDGAEIEFEVSDVIRKRNITKIGASGKVKSKVKHKVKHSYDLRAAFPKAHYNYMPGTQIPYTDADGYHKFRLKKKNISLVLEHIEKPEELLSIFAAAYQNVKPI